MRGTVHLITLVPAPPTETSRPGTFTARTYHQQMWAETAA